LDKEKGILGQIFTKSQNKIQDPAKLSKIVLMIVANSGWWWA
jgi:type I restriction enzyme M protein